MGRIDFVELGLHQHQLGTDASEACYDLLTVHHLLLACLEAFTSCFDGQPLVFYKMMDEAYKFDILPCILTRSARGLLRFQSRELLLPEA